MNRSAQQHHCSSLPAAAQPKRLSRPEKVPWIGPRANAWESFARRVMLDCKCALHLHSPPIICCSSCHCCKPHADICARKVVPSCLIEFPVVLSSPGTPWLLTRELHSPKKLSMMQTPSSRGELEGCWVRRAPGGASAASGDTCER